MSVVITDLKTSYQVGMDVVDRNAFFLLDSPCFINTYWNEHDGLAFRTCCYSLCSTPLLMKESLKCLHSSVEWQQTGVAASFRGMKAGEECE